MKVVICDRYDTINQILDIAPPCLKLIVEMDQTLPIIMRSDLTSRRSNSRHNKTKTLDRAASMNIQIVKFQDVERFGSGDSDVDADSGVGRKEERVRIARNEYKIDFPDNTSKYFMVLKWSWYNIYQNWAYPKLYVGLLQINILLFIMHTSSFSLRIHTALQ